MTPPPLYSETVSALQHLELKPCPLQLAQEIIDEIIDTFSACNDRAAIMPLTTVAMAWKPCSQRNLFHTHELWISKETLNNAREDRQTCSLDDLFSYVRVLRLHQPNTKKGLKASVWLLRLFSNVTELELQSWSFRQLPVDQVVRTLGHFGSTVQRLNLD
jgi:hypothetical protein